MHPGDAASPRAAVGGRGATWRRPLGAPVGAALGATWRRPLGAPVGAALGAAALLGAAVAWSLRRVVVQGSSMIPTLEPQDRLLVVRVPNFWPVPPGSIVAVRDPRDARRVLVKRVSRSRPGWVEVLGDNPPASTDSRHFGPVPRSAVFGCCFYRYGPPGRTGRL